MTDIIRNDGYESMLNGVGTQFDPTTNVIYRPDPELTQSVLEGIYAGDGLGRRIVEMPADEMVREWFEVRADEGEAVLDKLEVLGAKQRFAEAATWARLYGGAAVLPILDDGLDFDQPLRPERIRDVIGLQVYDRWSISYVADSLSLDPVKRLRGLPEFFMISPPYAHTHQFRCHESRLVLLPGKALPPRVRANNGGWDGPVLQGAFTALTRYSTGLGFAANIVRDFVQAVLSVKGLTNMLAAGKEDVVQRRIRLLDMSRSILNSMVIDADGEEFTKHANSVAGLPDILDRFAEHLCATTGIPVSKLFGRQPGGLQATGQHELRNYYDMLASEQERVLSPVAEFVVKLILLSSKGPTSGAEPDDWSVAWRSLQQPTDKETAELRKLVADVDKVYLDTGVLAASEVADSRFGQGEWSMETQLAAGTERNPVASLDPEDAAALQAEMTAGKPDDEDGPANADAAPRTLYVRRNVVNADEILAWAAEQGFGTTLEPNDLHVTIMFSRAKVDWMAMGESYHPSGGNLELSQGGPRLMEQFGAATVLLFASSELSWRHQEMKNKGATWDHAEYQPHITISYDDNAPDIASVEPYRGRIVLGPEIFEEVDEDWKARVAT